MKKEKMTVEQKNMYVLAWCILAGVLFLYLGAKWLGFDYDRWAMPCLFLKVTGLYCPGCGGTRAVRALLEGDVVQSFLYHPFVPYTALVGGWFLISNTVELVSRGKIPIGLLYRERYLYLGIGIILVHFVAENWIFL